jgi:tRNA(adenine34) deaminase
MNPQINFSAQDTTFMQHALQLARHANTVGEVPVGAIIVLNNQIISEGYNQPISKNDPTAHAEIIAMRNAAQHLQNYRLVGTTLYVTLEPCAMCAAAMLHARIERVVYAASDPKAGAMGGAIDLYKAHAWNHNPRCQGGLLAADCGTLLRQFFKQRR